MERSGDVRDAWVKYEVIPWLKLFEQRIQSVLNTEDSRVEIIVTDVLRSEEVT